MISRSYMKSGTEKKELARVSLVTAFVFHMHKVDVVWGFFVLSKWNNIILESLLELFHLKSQI